MCWTALRRTGPSSSGTSTMPFTRRMSSPCRWRSIPSQIPNTVQSMGSSVSIRNEVTSSVWSCGTDSAGARPLPAPAGDAVARDTALACTPPAPAEASGRAQPPSGEPPSIPSQRSASA